jgi:hypothetical protein
MPAMLRSLCHPVRQHVHGSPGRMTPISAIVATPRADRGLPRRAAPRQRLRHIRNAHPKQLGHLANPLAIIRRSEHPLAQILRISPASLIQHFRLRLPSTGDPGITCPSRFGSPYDSSNHENALGSAGSGCRSGRPECPASSRRGARRPCAASVYTSCLGTNARAACSCSCLFQV